MDQKIEELLRDELDPLINERIRRYKAENSEYLESLRLADFSYRVSMQVGQEGPHLVSVSLLNECSDKNKDEINNDLLSIVRPVVQGFKFKT